jgi:hypothetical protein
MNVPAACRSKTQGKSEVKAEVENEDAKQRAAWSNKQVMALISAMVASTEAKKSYTSAAALKWMLANYGQEIGHNETSIRNKMYTFGPVWRATHKYLESTGELSLTLTSQLLSSATVLQVRSSALVHHQM